MAKTTEELLAESTAAAQEAAKIIGGTFEQGKGFIPGETPVTAPQTPATEPVIPTPEIVSSQDIEAEKLAAEKRIQETGTAQKTALETEFQREKRLAEEASAEKITTARELSRGLGAVTSFALIDRIEKATKRDILELEESKNIALATGDVKRAEALADLQFKVTEFQFKSKQQAFENALAMNRMQIDIAKAEFTPDIKEYEFAVKQGYKGTLMDYQRHKQAALGLTPGQLQSSINQIAGQFDNEPIVKKYNQSAGGYQFMQNIESTTNNPADDIGMIYAFAKIMDPESVVREGEYATVQKYAQSWANNFGFNAARIFSNTKFLSTKSLDNMKATALAKFSADKQQYDNLSNEYQRRVKEVQSGKVVNPITDYSAAFGETGIPNSSNDFKNISPEQKTQVLDKLESEEKLGELGFVDKFLSIFGLQTK